MVDKSKLALDEKIKLLHEFACELRISIGACGCCGSPWADDGHDLRDRVTIGPDFDELHPKDGA